MCLALALFGATRGAAIRGVSWPQTSTRIHMAHSAELARIKSTPTDAELATQIDEVESKVRVRCPSQHLTVTPFYNPRRPCMLGFIGRKTPRTPRAFARWHTARLNSRARDTRRRVGAVALRMGPAEKGVLQVRAFPLPLPCYSLYNGSKSAPDVRLTTFLNEIKKASGRSSPTRCLRLMRANLRKI